MKRASAQNKLEVGEAFATEVKLQMNRVWRSMKSLKWKHHQGEGINGEAATIDKVETYPHM